jgi:hypothetical protein
MYHNDEVTFEVKEVDLMIHLVIRRRDAQVVVVLTGEQALAVSTDLRAALRSLAVVEEPGGPLWVKLETI